MKNQFSNHYKLNQFTVTSSNQFTIYYWEEEIHAKYFATSIFTKYIHKVMSDIFNKFLFFTSKNMKDVFYFT